MTTALCTWDSRPLVYIKATTLHVHYSLAFKWKWQTDDFIVLDKVLGKGKQLASNSLEELWFLNRKNSQVLFLMFAVSNWTWMTQTVTQNNI